MCMNKLFALLLALCLVCATAAGVLAETAVESPFDDDIDIHDETTGPLVEDVSLIDLGAYEPEWDDAPAEAGEVLSAEGDFEVDGSGKLIGYTGPGGDIVIPDGVKTLQDFTLTSHIDVITSIVIPGSVKEIPWMFLNGCTTLESVTIQPGVQVISGYAFAGCTALKSVTIPDTVTTIGEHAFQHCESLPGIVLPDSVTELGEGALAWCYSLKDVKLPGKLTRLNDSIFFTCTSLESVVIPDSVTEMATFIFYGCEKLKSVKIPDGVKSIGSSCFAYCTSLKTVTFPSKLTELSSAMFSFSGLQSFTIPPSVREIGHSVFEYCENLTSMVIPKGVTKLDAYTFSNMDKLQTVTLPASVTEFSSQQVISNCPNVTLLVEKGSAAQAFAEEYGFKYKIISANDLSGATVTVKDAVYNKGKAVTPVPVVKLDNKTLKNKTDYTVSYKNNKKIGTATVTVKGKGKYSGSKKVTFAINPKALSLGKLTAGKKQLTVKWKKVSGISGYQLEYGRKKDLSDAVQISLKKTAIKKAVSGLVSKGTYYVRIRVYKKVGGKKYFSAWSKTKKITVK